MYLWLAYVLGTNFFDLFDIDYNVVLWVYDNEDHCVKSKLIDLETEVLHQRDDCKSIYNTPLIIFSLFCFIIIIVLTSVRTYRKGPPSLMTLGSQTFMSTLSCFLLITIGILSTKAQWALMIIFVLVILFFAISVIDPDMFNYSNKLRDNSMTNDA